MTDTKTRIMEVATNLFFKKGFYRVTLTEIARGAKVSQPGIYNHYEDMDDIMVSACVHWLEEGKTFIDGRIDTLQRARLQLEVMLSANLEYTFNNRRKYALILGLSYYATHSSKAKQTYQFIVTSGVSRMKELVVRGNQDHSWFVADVDKIASMLYKMLISELMNLIVEPEKEELAERSKRFLEEVFYLLPIKPKR